MIFLNSVHVVLSSLVILYNLRFSYEFRLMLYVSSIAGDRQLLQARFNESSPRKVECCAQESEGCQVWCQEEEQTSIEDPWQEVN